MVMNGPVVVSCKYVDKILILPQKYRNPNNTIRIAMARVMQLSANYFSLLAAQMYSQSMERVLAAQSPVEQPGRPRT